MNNTIYFKDDHYKLGFMSFTTDGVHRGQRILFLVKEKLYTDKCMQEYNFYEQNFHIYF